MTCQICIVLKVYNHHNHETYTWHYSIAVRISISKKGQTPSRNSKCEMNCMSAATLFCLISVAYHMELHTALTFYRHCRFFPNQVKS